MPDLTIALVGKTGHGKSSTGNTILQQIAFEESSDTTDSTELLTLKRVKFGKLNVRVYDLPGLQSQKFCKEHVKRQLLSLMDSAQQIHVFIFVFNYTNRFSAEEGQAFAELQSVFGSDFLRKHGMIVVTHGDNCAQEALEKKIPTEQVFKKWCENSGEKFNNLRRMVDSRILLVHNKGSFEDTSERMVSSEKIHEIALKMFNQKEPFTKDEFDEIQRNKELLRQRQASNQSSDWCSVL